MYQNTISPLLKNLLKVYLRDCWWSIYGRKFKNPDIHGPVNSILYICKGNICRSPFAEHISRKIANNDQMLFASAGLQVAQSNFSPKKAISVARKFGVNLNQHSSKQLDQNMLQSYDLVLAMEAKQLQELRKMLPKHQDKVHLLPQYDLDKIKIYKAYYHYNIVDPFNKGQEAFYACFIRIECCVYNLLQKTTHYI